MPAWPGGPCPDCGEDMPANLLRCMTCRSWLNEELTRPEPDIPEPFELPELPPKQVPRSATVAGHYIICPGCQKELRVANHFLDNTVQCRFCETCFQLDLERESLRHVGIYVDCPHCEEELRVARKYLGHGVVCRICDGRVQMPALGHYAT